jgi:hypothetical protein
VSGDAEQKDPLKALEMRVHVLEDQNRARSAAQRLQSYGGAGLVGGACSSGGMVCSMCSGMVCSMCSGMVCSMCSGMVCSGCSGCGCCCGCGDRRESEPQASTTRSPTAAELKKRPNSEKTQESVAE